MLFRQIVFNALMVGILAGAVLTIVQAWQVVPIILSAEQFEGVADSHASHGAATVDEHAGHGHDHASHGHEAAATTGHSGHSGHSHSPDEWAPADGFERTAYTFLSNALTAIGFSLLMIATMVASVYLRIQRQMNFEWWHGLVWGAAGYVIFWLAPAIGMPPEIPLAVAAPLELRQLWWLFAVVCTGAGLIGLAFGPSLWRWFAPVLLVVPHLVGAPHPPGAMFEGQPAAVAAELEQLMQQFFAATAIANAVLWLVIGLASAWVVRRLFSAPSDITSHSKLQSPSI